MLVSPLQTPGCKLVQTSLTPQFHMPQYKSRPCLQEIVNDDNGNNDNGASDDASPQVINQINKVCLWSGASQVASPASEFYIRSATSFLPRNIIFLQNKFV